VWRCVATRERLQHLKAQTEEVPRVNLMLFIFSCSTDPAAKERLFLKLFTLFQQAKCCGYATLATRRDSTVELERKSKRYFASSSPFTERLALRSLCKRRRGGNATVGD
jgi:hypothetical protein